MSNRVSSAVGVGNGTVQHRNGIEAFKIRGVWQDQIGIRHHLAGVGIGINDFRNFIFAVVIFCGQPAHRFFGIHGRVPAHIGHKHHQHIDRIRIAIMGIANYGMHHAVRGERVRPGIGMINSTRVTVFINDQIFGAVYKTQGRCIEFSIDGNIFSGTICRWNWARERRLVTERAWRINGAQQHL